MRSQKYREDDSSDLARQADLKLSGGSEDEAKEVIFAVNSRCR